MLSTLYNEHIGKVLGSLGIFNSTEINIYLALTKHNPSNIADLCRMIQNYRTNVMNSLNNLIEKGFVREEITDSKRIFYALEPEKLKEYFQQKQVDLDEVLPELQQWKQAQLHDEQATITHGISSVKTALMDLLKEQQPINVYGMPIQCVEILGEAFLREFHRKRIRVRIPLRVIYNQKPEKRIPLLNSLRFTQAKYFTKQYNTLVSTLICRDQVLFFVNKEPVSLIFLRSQEIAEAYDRYFEILWDRAQS